MKRSEMRIYIIMEKNQECIVKIEDMSLDGEGVGRVNGYALFVKDTVIGDEVRVKITKTNKTYGYARLIDVLVPSPHRVQARCPDSIDNRFIDRCTYIAGRCLYYRVGSSCIKTDTDISVLVLADRELGLISVKERLVHSDDLFHLSISNTAYSSYILLYHSALESKLPGI